MNNSDVLILDKGLLKETFNLIASELPNRIPQKFFRLYEEGFYDALDSVATILELKRVKDRRYEYAE